MSRFGRLGPAPPQASQNTAVSGAVDDAGSQGDGAGESVATNDSPSSRVTVRPALMVGIRPALAEMPISRALSTFEMSGACFWSTDRP